MAKGFSLVAGGAVDTQVRPARPSPPDRDGEGWRLPAAQRPTLCELFADRPADAGWAGFLLAHLQPGLPLLWVQERMAIRELGRAHPPGVGWDLLHVEAPDARSALWAMEEGLKCAGLSAVIGEIRGDPHALDFTATRRLAVAAERSTVPCWLVRLHGQANLSGARMRWRVASAPSLANPLDPRAPGVPAWEADLFRARGASPGCWTVTGEAGAFHLAAEPGDRALGQDKRLSA